MQSEIRYPVLDVDLEVIRDNAHTMCGFCARHGIDVAGVIKFSDGDIDVAKAYADGGCVQIASSRAVHLERIKNAYPEITTMLIRIPMMSEVDRVVRYCDISLNSEESVLRGLDEAARSCGRVHSVVLMQDAGDRREGVYDRDELIRMAVLVENELRHLHLAGIGASFACVSGVLPNRDNLGELAESAEQIEKAIGRELEIVSGGSSITLTLLASGTKIPSKINHLRIGGAIANPVTIRNNRGVIIDGMREDAFSLTAEIVEVKQKPSPPGGKRRNWSGNILEYEDLGVRKRAIAALGSQDIGDCMQLIPRDPGVSVIAGSSDHTVLDVEESGREWKPGDTVSFGMYYEPLLCCFSTRHVSVRFRHGGRSGIEEL